MAGPWSRRRFLGASVSAAALPIVGCTSDPEPPPSAGDRFIVRGARIFDGERLTDADSVLVERGMITAVGRNLGDPDGVAVHDAAGRTLLPGLIDAHVHGVLPDDPDGPAFGVTTMLDMFTMPEVLSSYRDRRASVEHRAADVWSAGTVITVPGGHATQFRTIPTVGPGADPGAFVQARLDEGSDFVKIVIEDGSVQGSVLPTLTAEQATALVAATKARSALSVAHVSTAQGAAVAAAAGVEVLVHLPSRAVDQPLADTIARLDMAVVSTLIVVAGASCDAGTPALVDDPRIGPRLTRVQRELLGHDFPRCWPPPAWADTVANVGVLRRAGVPILAGTDAGNPGVVLGASLHGELELLVKAGLPPVEALAGATSLPARRFGLGDRGRIAAGQRADLVLVGGDPTADITATRDIVMVWKNGYPVTR